MENPTSEVKLDDFLRMGEVASQIRALSDQIGSELDSDKKEEIKRKLISAAQIRGENITAPQAELAIDSFFADKYSFKEPKKGFANSFFNAYVMRKTIAKVVGIPLVAISLVTGASWGISKMATEVKLSKQESRIERAVLDQYNRVSSIDANIFTISKSPLVSDLPLEEKTSVAQLTVDAKSQLSSTESFFVRYAKEGKVPTLVTRENMAEVEGLLPSIISPLDKAESDTKQGLEKIAYQEKLNTVKANLTSLISETRGLNLPTPFLKKAEAEYSGGVALVERRDLANAEKVVQSLAKTKSESQNFMILTTKLSQVYESIKQIAKEQKALEINDGLYLEARKGIDTFNFDELNSGYKQMKDLEEKLNQTYTLKIVSREGIKSGAERSFYAKCDSRLSPQELKRCQQQTGGRVSGHFLAVEAIGRDGQPIKTEIVDSESGRTKSVDIWGEQVPREIYETIKADKMADGVIDQNVFGVKMKGYLTPEIKMKGVKQFGKQIFYSNW